MQVGNDNNELCIKMVREKEEKLFPFTSLFKESRNRWRIISSELCMADNSHALTLRRPSQEEQKQITAVMAQYCAAEGI